MLKPAVTISELRICTTSATCSWWIRWWNLAVDVEFEGADESFALACKALVKPSMAELHSSAAKRMERWIPAATKRMEKVSSSKECHEWSGDVGRERRNQLDRHATLPHQVSKRIRMNRSNVEEETHNMSERIAAPGRDRKHGEAVGSQNWKHDCEGTKTRQLLRHTSCGGGGAARQRIDGVSSRSLVVGNMISN